MADAVQVYVGGRWTDPLSGGRRDIVDPCSGRPCGAVSLADAAEVDRAVSAARGAFDRFAQSSRADRMDLLSAIIEGYTRRMDELTASLVRELGAPLAFARDTQTWIGLAHLQQALETLRHYSFAHSIGTTRILREPAGVAALITPWNWPLNQIVVKVAPALATGCTMVLKPSELTPGCAAIFADIMHEAGVPAGVFNMIQGEGPVAGRALAAHPDVDVVSFTGSTRAGIDVAQTAAPGVKRVLQELGGKSPFIVLPDADLAAAVASCAAICFANTGQSCDAPTRLLVPRAWNTRAQDLARAAAQAVRVGDPADPETTMGPLISQRQFDHVQRLVHAGIDEGATLVAGGEGRPDGRTEGFFVQPTVFADVTPAMAVAREEIFGPVVTIMAYDDEREAVRIANDTLYGLAAYVHGADLVHARQVAGRLRAGVVYVNDPALDLAAPFGGYKQSGNGREYGAFGFDDFTEIKAVVGFGLSAES